MKLLDLVRDLPDAQIMGDTCLNVEGMAYDSRFVSQGWVFVCITGYKVDGHNYIKDAANRGACVVVVEKEVDVPEGITIVKVEDSRDALALMSAAYFGYPTKGMKLIGVTGTNGKTSTSYYLKSILDSTDKKTAILGTIGVTIENMQSKA